MSGKMTTQQYVQALIDQRPVYDNQVKKKPRKKKKKGDRD